MATILLIRHGENDWVKEGRLAGWLPGVHLNDHGRAQAAAAAERIAALPLAALYSSPVTRCEETAAVIGARLGLEVQPLAAVGEVRYGEWEGKKLKELAKDPLWRTVQFAPSRMTFPGGESLREVQARAVEAVETLSRRHEKAFVAVVSHADVIKLVVAHYLGMHLDQFQRIRIAPASVSVVHLSSNGLAQVARVNDDGPLQPPPPETDEAPAAEAAAEADAAPEQAEAAAEA